MSLTQPTKTYRGTWDELMNRRSEISPDAVLEVRVYQPEPAPQADKENQALIDLLHSWWEEDVTDDTQELERRDVETNDLMARLQANRMSGDMAQSVPLPVLSSTPCLCAL